MRFLFYALRPKQWVKNFFILLPLIFAKKLFVFPDNVKALFAFFLFCLASSAAYLINDITDAKKDKLHPTKRLRPIASGKVSKQQAAACALFLAALSVILSFILDVYFGRMVLVYLVFNFLYSKTLKHAVIIDVFCIGAFFLLRVMSGSVVAGIEMSHWMISMTVLLALFLGFNKRRQELQLLTRHARGHRRVLTHYNPYFIDQMIAVITSSVVITYMLYTVDDRTVGEFGTKNLMYTIPFVYYGIFRYLYLIHKVKKEGDPTRILFSDRPMQINILLWVLACIAIVYFL